MKEGTGSGCMLLNRQVAGSLRIGRLVGIPNKGNSLELAISVRKVEDLVEAFASAVAEQHTDARANPFFITVLHSCEEVEVGL